MPEGFIEEGDAYIVPWLGGRAVVRLTLDTAITLHLGVDEVSLTTPFELDDTTGRVEIVPASSSRMGAIEELFGAVCESVRIAKSGTLVVRFADGRVITSPASGPGRSWEVSIRRRWRAVGADGHLSFSSP